MISKIVVDLLGEEGVKSSPDVQPEHIDDTFMPRSRDDRPPAPGSGADMRLSTERKLNILDWASMDRQLRSYGFNKLDDLSLSLINESARKHITDGNSHSTLDFRSDSIPFVAKYNVAIALSCSEAIGILSDLDTCEIYASAEVKQIFQKHGRYIMPGLNSIRFDELPLDMKRALVWPMVQNLYRALTVRKAARVFPEGIPGKLAYEALISKCENEQLASQLSHLDPLKYSDYRTIYFSDPADLEVKYHLAVYCLSHIGEIKPAQTPAQETPTPQEDKPTAEDEEQHVENVKKLEEEYIAAFRRINKKKSFWDKISMADILEMGRDVMDAIKEEVKNFAQLKQGIISRLAGRSEVAIEDEELTRIFQGQNPNFVFASQYLAMFFQPSDYYSILGLDSAKTLIEKDVKDAFKRQAKIYHPDKNSDDPNKEEKEKRFKLLMVAKDALLKQLSPGKKAPAEFRDDVSLTSYLGSMSKLFGECAAAGHHAHKHQKKVETLEPSKQYREEAESVQDMCQDKEERGMDIDEDTAQEPVEAEEYLGPYYEEMRILGSMIGGWTGKEILIIGAGREPGEFSMPVILSRIGASVSAVDVNYRGPAEFGGCQYYRASADRVNNIFQEEQFDVVISTAMFGAPFTNWAVREFNLNSFDEGLKDRIRELELEVIGKLLALTKSGGMHFHHNRDLNPQSWSFDEVDLREIGCESASHPDDLPNPEEIWLLRK